MKIDKKELAVSSAKSIFGTIPFVGQLLSEVAFDYRSRIKQNRLNSFVELLSKYFENSENVHFEALKSEEFSDLFESVLKRVTQTKSQTNHRLRGHAIPRLKIMQHNPTGKFQ